MKGSSWYQGARQTCASNRHAEFLSRSTKKDRIVLAPSSPYSWSNLPVKGIDKNLPVFVYFFLFLFSGI